MATTDISRSLVRIRLCGYTFVSLSLELTYSIGARSETLTRASAPVSAVFTTVPPWLAGSHLHVDRISRPKQPNFRRKYRPIRLLRPACPSRGLECLAAAITTANLTGLGGVSRFHERLGKLAGRTGAVALNFTDLAGSATAAPHGASFVLTT